MRSLSLLGLIFLGTGCATLSSKSDGTTPASPVEPPAKTLFGWQPGPSNGDGTEVIEGSSDAPKPPEPDEIVTDRPDFTEASSTVGRGRIQLETGYTYSRDLDSGVRNAHSYPEVLLRAGVFADWFELRLGQNYSHTKAFAGDGGVFGTSGGEDLYLGVKLGLTEQKAYLPEMALVLQSTVPTGHRNLTSGRIHAGMNLLYGWDVVPDLLSFAGSSQGNSATDDDGQSYLELAQSVTVGYTITSRLGAYTEFFAFFPHGATAPDTVAQYYFNGGFTYKFTPNFQYDVRAGVGLNRHAEDFFVGTGFAVRY